MDYNNNNPSQISSSNYTSISITQSSSNLTDNNIINKNFIINYNSIKHAYLQITENDIIKMNNEFISYINYVFQSNNIDEIIQFFIFYNEIDTNNDIFKIKTQINICLIFKSLALNYINVSVNLMLSNGIIELLKYMETHFELSSYKSYLLKCIIDITNNNLYNIDKNKAEICNDISISVSSLDNLSISTIIEELNLEIYNALIQFLIALLNSYHYWISNNTVIKCYNILQYRKYIYKSILYNLNTIIMSYCLPQLNINNNDVGQSIKWISTTYNIDNRILLCSNLINMKDYNVNNYINDFKNTYPELIYKLENNDKDINIFIDGYNTFYNTNTRYANTNNIDIYMILQVLDNIENYKNTIRKLLIKNGTINPSKKENTNKSININIKIVFNEKYNNIINGNVNGNGNEDKYFIYTNSNIKCNDILLYLWLVYNGSILVSNNKHLDYFEIIRSNRYLMGLFNEYKKILQLSF